MAESQEPPPHELSDDEIGLVVGDDGTFCVLSSHPGQPLSDKQLASVAAAVRAARDPVYAQEALDWWALVTLPAGHA